MLKGVQSQIGKVGGLLVTEHAEDRAFVVKLVPIVRPTAERVGRHKWQRFLGATPL
jgi:hypothetical protein